jgi:hypothetical protein
MWREQDEVWYEEAKGDFYNFILLNNKADLHSYLSSSFITYYAVYLVVE